jgi:Ca-activated chloride channel homolog
MISFDHPLYFVLLSFLPVGIYLRHFWRGRGGRIRFSFAKWKGEAFTYSAIGLRLLRLIGSCSFWLATGSLILAMAGPIVVTRETVYLTRGMDIMIVLDESPSMSARDFNPGNRFESAREVIRRFIAARENDAIGLVSFSREAALRVPPTLDRATLTARLEELTIMSLGDGTAIGLGLSVAAMHLERSGAAERIILLVTDGENNAGEILPETAADLAMRLGIRIYTIGVGTQGEVPIEYTDPTTGILRQGMFDSRFNEELLVEIAEQTGGRYYAARSPGALQAVFRSIDGIETTGKQARIDVRAGRIHADFIMIALVLLLLDFLIRIVLLREVLS